MSSAKERKNYIATCLKASGVAESSIIAILCNAATESGHTYNPGQWEIGQPHDYGHGFGIWQWTGNEDHNKAVAYYNAGHTEKENIKYQVGLLLNTPGQWIGSFGNYGLTFNQFLKNSKHLSWKQLTSEWCMCWERPADAAGQAVARQANYSEVMPIDYGNTSDAGGDSGGDDGGDGKDSGKTSYLTLEECRKILAQNEGSKDSDQDPGTGQQIDGGISESKIDAFYQACQDAGTAYSQPNRNRILSDKKYCDCSAFVSRVLEIGYGLSDKTLYNTETLHGFLAKIGFKLYKDGTDGGWKGSYKAGDVWILGAKGTSIGNYGHAMYQRSDSHLWQCSSGWGGSCAVTNDDTNKVMSYDSANWQGNNWHWYIYRPTK